MAIHLTFSDEAQYLLVEIVGDVWKARDGVDAILLIAERAREDGHKRILIDRRDLSNPATEFGRFEAARTIAEVLPPPSRLAVVYPLGEVASLGENAAVNRGATAAAFSSLEDAKQWLLEGLSS